MFHRYVENVSQATGIEKEKVAESEPAKKFLDSMID